MNTPTSSNLSPFVIVLGTAQDGGYPHIGCERACCKAAWEDEGLRRWVVSLALVDPLSKKWWLFEATPDIREQLHLFAILTAHEYTFLPEGIFITHAHFGHYTGLMQLGRESLGAVKQKVCVLGRMKEFLSTNAPWEQLVSLENISIVELSTTNSMTISDDIHVEAFTVPHRDEYSETAGFRIVTTSGSYLFIPDIDKWSQWHRNIIEEVSRVEIAFLDGTFYSVDELAHRRIKEVPHPMVVETMDLFSDEDLQTRNKIHFIHCNHSNPLIWSQEKREEIRELGFSLAMQNNRY